MTFIPIIYCIYACRCINICIYSHHQPPAWLSVLLRRGSRMSFIPFKYRIKVKMPLCWNWPQIALQRTLHLFTAHNPIALLLPCTPATEQHADFFPSSVPRRLVHLTQEISASPIHLKDHLLLPHWKQCSLYSQIFAVLVFSLCW